MEAQMNYKEDPMSKDYKDKTELKAPANSTDNKMVSISKANTEIVINHSESEAESNPDSILNNHLG